MRRADKVNSRPVNQALAGRTEACTARNPGGFSMFARGQRKVAVAAATWLIAIASIACAADLTVPGSPAGPSGDLVSNGEAGSREQGGVRVPDEISDLDSAEVERRLGRLLGDGNGAEAGAVAAQEAEPTVTAAGEPTLQEILDLLNSGTVSIDSGEIVISVSQGTIDMLADPRLTIKTQPEYGSATVISPSQILYVPGEPGGNSDSFEYELFDGIESVIALTVEIRQ